MGHGDIVVGTLFQRRFDDLVSHRTVGALLCGELLNQYVALHVEGIDVDVCVGVVVVRMHIGAFGRFGGQGDGQISLVAQFLRRHIEVVNSSGSDGNLGQGIASEGGAGLAEDLKTLDGGCAKVEHLSRKFGRTPYLEEAVYGYRLHDEVGESRGVLEHQLQIGRSVAAAGNIDPVAVRQCPGDAVGEVGRSIKEVGRITGGDGQCVAQIECFAIQCDGLVEVELLEDGGSSRHRGCGNGLATKFARKKNLHVCDLACAEGCAQTGQGGAL